MRLAITQEQGDRLTELRVAAHVDILSRKGYQIRLVDTMDGAAVAAAIGPTPDEAFADALAKCSNREAPLSRAQVEDRVAQLEKLIKDSGGEVPQGPKAKKKVTKKRNPASSNPTRIPR